MTPCLYKSGALIGQGWTTILNGGDTDGYEIGYTLGSAWTQATGGDVYASGIINSYIPVVAPRVFNLNGGGGYPGVVTYGTGAYFAGNDGSGRNGTTLVSSTNWLANATRPSTDYYSYFYNKLGAPTTTDNALFPDLIKNVVNA